ncbi:MAG: hypothetical protein RR365_08850 [Bacteroides sp.]
MIKIKYELYWSDLIRKNREETFLDLDGLEDWIFNQMQQDYTKTAVMYFPNPATAARIHADGPGRIQFTPRYGGESVWIHQIQSGGYLIFSDGQFTSGQKHWSKDIQKWLAHCDERKRSPKFNFMA